MAYTFDNLFAADPSNPSMAASNAAIILFDPNDPGKTPVSITDPTGSPLPNPITVNKNGFGPSIQHATLDRLGWSGGGFEGFITSYEGIKNEAVAAKEAAEAAGADAAAAAAAGVASVVADAEAAATASAEASASANAAATSAASAAALVDAPADSAIATAINGTGTATAAALAAVTIQAGTDSAIPGYGIVPQNLGKWKAAVARVRAGQGHANVLCAGTSKTWGYPSSFGAGKSWPSQLEKMLNAYHVPAAEGWVSCSSKSYVDNVFDPRITKGSGWAAGGNGTGPGQGGGMQWVSGTGTISFAPGYQFDTISLFYVTFTNKGTVTVNINGGASLGSVNANAAAGLGVSTVTCALGTHTINVTAPTGGDFQLLAIRAYDSTRKSVLVSNFGVDASKSADWANTDAGFSSLNSWDKLTPDLSIILHSTNDAGNTVSVSTYTANMTALINKAATYGSVVVGTETPDNDSEPNYVNYEALYQPALKDLAKSKSVPYLNLTKRYTSETAGRTLGFIHADRVHLTTLGSADVAGAVFKAITA